MTGDEANILLVSGEDAAWWTFAGGRVNAALAYELANRLDAKVSSDNFAVRGSCQAWGPTPSGSPWKACGGLTREASWRRPASRPSTG